MKMARLWLLLALCLLLLSGCDGDESKYNQAVSLMLEGQYEEASTIFKSLDEYADSQDKLYECEKYIDYDKAKDFVEAEDYENARTLLRTLEGFQDADALLRQCNDTLSYRAAVTQMEAGDLDTARNTFLSLGDFLDSPVKAEECVNQKKYNEAVAMMERLDYVSARAAFAALGGFKDSATMVQRIDELSEDEIWRAALVTNTYEGYAAFLEDPAGRYYTSALDRCEFLLWENAVQVNTPQAYQDYLDKLPEGKNAEKAQEILDEFSVVNADDAYQSAQETDTIAALQIFIDENPKSAHVPEAQSKIESMKTDTKYFDALGKKPTEEAILQFLSDFPNHVKEPDAQLLLKQFNDTLKAFMDNGTIKVTVKGGSMQRCLLTIKNQNKTKITVNLDYGVYFIATDATHDNMLLTAQYSIEVGAKETVTRDVQTASMNMNRDKPDSSDTFQVGILSSGHKLVRVLPLLESSKAGYPIIQAAIWIVTDNATDTALTESIFYTNGSPVITQTDITQARQILTELE